MRDPTLWKILCILLVRLNLEYAVQFWSPTKEIELELIETVQARAILHEKILYLMRNLRYETRQTKWEVNRLEDMSVRGDLIEIYISVNTLVDIN